MTEERFIEFLTALRDRCGARLCGSWADGTQDMKPGMLSDIDLVVRYAERECAKTRPIEEAIKVFHEFNVPWTSSIVGQLSSPRDLETLPRPVEIMESSWITPNRGYSREINLFGVTFQTFRFPWR